MSNFSELTRELEDYITLNVAVIVQAIKDIHGTEAKHSVDAVEFITSDLFISKCEELKLNAKLVMYAALHPEEFLFNTSIAFGSE
jgi:hypothetical protein